MDVVKLIQSWAGTLNKITVTKKIDSLLGPLIAPVVERLFPPKDRTGKDISAVLIIRPGGIGDAVLLIPTIALLKEKYPHAVIEVLTEKRNSGVFTLSPGVSSVFHYDAPAEFLATLQRTYDVVIDSEQWHRLSAIVARLTRAPMTIGFATNERKKMFTHTVPYSHDEYEMHSFMNLLTPLIGTITRDIDMPFLTIPPDVTDKVKPLLMPVLSNKMVALFPGGSIAERQWGSGRFHKTAKLLSDQGYGIVAVGGNDDVRAGQEIVSGLSNALTLCGKLSLHETAALLKESSLLIAGDSGIMHVGYGLGIKIVALFGPGRELKWAPRSSRVAVINKHLSCSPCTTFGYTPKCKNNAECMKLITAEEVFAQAVNLLENTS
jgi:lipopolysaccharide heptosyltransferase II